MKKYFVGRLELLPMNYTKFIFDLELKYKFLFDHEYSVTRLNLIFEIIKFCGKQHIQSSTDLQLLNSSVHKNGRCLYFQSRLYSMFSKLRIHQIQILFQY